MLVQVCLLLLSVGVYASYADTSDPITEDPLFAELEVFPESFLTKYPQEGGFFRTKILVYLFFNIFSKYFAENEPIKFWSKFNRNDFNRAAIDAAFYEYLTKFTSRKMKDRVYNPLASSASSTEDIAIDRIGEYLDHLSETEVPAEVQSETESHTYETESYKKDGAVCVIVPLRDPSFGIPGKDFPNYCDIPKTSFTCANKLIPGVYADIETGCQVFHICWADRIDSFLCPIGSTFNQVLLTCGFWYESDCGSSSHFDHSLFPKGKTPPRNTEGPSTPTPDMDIPEYDGTCQSLISQPLQLHMKFQPAKCEVRDLKSKPQTIEFDAKHFNRLADILTGVFRDTLAFIIKAVEHGRSDIAKMQVAAKLQKLQLKQTPKSHSRIVEEAAEFPSECQEIHETSEEHAHHLTTELPAEHRSPSPDSRFVEKPPIKTTSHEKVKPGKSAHSKPSRLSEGSKKHLLDMMMKTLDLGGHVLGDDILPFMEKMVLDSPRKMSKLNKH